MSNLFLLTVEKEAMSNFFLLAISLKMLLGKLRFVLRALKIKSVTKKKKKKKKRLTSTLGYVILRLSYWFVHQEVNILKLR